MKEVEFFKYANDTKDLASHGSNCFFEVMEPQGPLFEVFVVATPSLSEHIISDTEGKPDLRELKSLESLLLDPTAEMMR